MWATHVPSKSEQSKGLIIADIGFLWVSSAAVATIAAIVVSSVWERRKLSRTERAVSYADFLGLSSQLWRSFADRDGASKRGATFETHKCNERIRALRSELYTSYARIQILGSQRVVESALAYLRLSDDRNRAFKVSGAPGVALDTRAAALATFVEECRLDLSLKPLDKFRLHKDFRSMSGAHLEP